MWIGAGGGGGLGVARLHLGVRFWGWGEGTQRMMSVETGRQTGDGGPVEAGAQSFCSVEFWADLRPP